MKVDTLANGARLARGLLPAAMRGSAVVSVAAELAWSTSSARIVRLDYQFMKRLKPRTGRNGRVWAGFVEVEVQETKARLASHGEYTPDQEKAIASRIGMFPPAPLELEGVVLDLSQIESCLQGILTEQPAACTLALCCEGGLPAWTLVAEKPDGEVVSVQWNVRTGDRIRPQTDAPGRA